MLYNSQVGTLFGASKPSMTLCKEEKPQKWISILHHCKKQINNIFHDARICAMLQGFPSNHKTIKTQSTHDRFFVYCLSLKSGAWTNANPLEDGKT
jgi:hypothetical protein